MSQNVRGSNSNDDVDADSLVSSSPQAGIPIGKPPSTEPAIFGFDDMHLVVGDWLQVECPAPSGIGRVFVRVVGYVEGISLIVSDPKSAGEMGRRYWARPRESEVEVKGNGFTLTTGAGTKENPKLVYHYSVVKPPVEPSAAAPVKAAAAPAPRPSTPRTA